MGVKFYCPMCDKPFSTSTAMNEHARSCSYPKDKRKGGNGK